MAIPGVRVSVTVDSSRVRERLNGLEFNIGVVSRTISKNIAGAYAKCYLEAVQASGMGRDTGTAQDRLRTQIRNPKKISDTAHGVLVDTHIVSLDSPFYPRTITITPGKPRLQLWAAKRGITRGIINVARYPWIDRGNKCGRQAAQVKLRRAARRLVRKGRR